MWSIAFIVLLSKSITHRHEKCLSYPFEQEGFSGQQAQFLTRFEKQVVSLNLGQFLHLFMVFNSL